MSKGGNVFKRISLSKRIMLVLSLVGILALAAVPALSQPVFFGSNGSGFNDGSNGNSFNDVGDPVSQRFSERNIRSGSASPSFSFSNTGNNVNACPSAQQVANTGNIANEQGVTQYNTDTGDISFDGSSITIDPTADSSCTQSIDQSGLGW
jgi:hypothetical protein